VIKSVPGLLVSHPLAHNVGHVLDDCFRWVHL
jgi:hypothetical protein